MRPLGNKTILFTVFALLAGCGDEVAEAPAQPQETPAETRTGPPEGAPTFGLMTSLPLYWPLGADFQDFANGEAQRPWARVAIEQRYAIEPLDTLSPIAGIEPGDPETDPLADLERLAVIQPRGLTPSDNVALDNWLRAGGHLLLVLDPMLTGEYELPLGDPGRPTDSALIPPVVKRWGMQIAFEEQEELVLQEAPLAKGKLWLSMAGTVSLAADGKSACEFFAQNTVARCDIGEGTVTILADAASFEHAPGEVENSLATEPPLLTILDFAFDPEKPEKGPIGDSAGN